MAKKETIKITPIKGKKKTAFQELLEKGPTWTKAQFINWEKERKQLMQWQIQ